MFVSRHHRESTRITHKPPRHDVRFAWLFPIKWWSQCKFCFCQVDQPTNHDITYAAYLHVVGILQHPTICPTVRSTQDTMINAVRQVVATIPNSTVGSRSGSDPERISWNGSYQTKTRTVAIGPVLPPKTRHCNIISCTLNKYLSLDHIVTWSIWKLCNVMCSFTSRFQMCNPTNIDWVAIDHPHASLESVRYFTAILWLLVGWQICKRTVTEWIQPLNLHIDHVTIQSELRYLIGAKVEPKWKEP